MNGAKLKGLVGNIIGTNRRLILRAKNTGDWLNIHGTAVTGTVLSAMGFCDLLCAYYNVTPLNLQSHCEGWGTAFEVHHTLILRKGGLVIVCPNRVQDKLLYLS